MPQFAANLSMMFTEVPFLDRFQAAAEAGFQAVEFLFPYDFPAAEIAQRLQNNQLSQALFNLPPGDWEKGERGLAALPGRQDDFRRAVERAIPYIEATKVGRVHAMAGIVDPADQETYLAIYQQNLVWASEQLAQHHIDVLIEPLNNRDVPNYLLNRTDQAVAILETLAIDNLKLQFDIYHCQIMEGDVSKRLQRHFPYIGHVQIAGVPERHEPNIGELNYPYLFTQLDQLGYAGYIGCEYHPQRVTLAGLTWLSSN